MRSIVRFWTSYVDRSQYGRLLTPISASAADREVMDHCSRIVRITKRELERRYHWNLDPVDFFFLSAREPNAATFRRGRRHAVGMSVGLLRSMRKHLRRAMRERDFLPNYLSSRERPEWMWRFLGMMVEHVYLHELAHALRGHADYVEHGRAACAMDDRSAERPHHLELDADLHALDMWASITEVSPDYPSGNRVLLEDLYFQKVFSLLLLYQALDCERLPARLGRGQSHPPQIHRALLLTETMLGSSRSWLGIPQRAIRRAHHQAWWEASVAARAAGLTRDRWWGSSGRRRGIAVYRSIAKQYLEQAEPRINRFLSRLPRDPV